MLIVLFVDLTGLYGFRIVGVPMQVRNKDILIERTYRCKILDFCI